MIASGLKRRRSSRKLANGRDSRDRRDDVRAEIRLEIR
jgi:hypothetical protein